ncbi:MAG: RNA polymerase factor sigma-54 [Beggiatoa sp. IS2]|nr:MAG: RNA polymerase factor sigma-54 [Beggiatoa sp. IS2]
MKQSLRLRLGQQITMTPQLQQAIRLLQLSTLDLQMEIRQTLESNIMLEAIDENELSVEDSQEEISDYDAETSDTADEFSSSEENDEIKLDDVTDIPTELVVDSEWEDIYDSASSQHESTSSDLNSKDFNAIGAPAETLQGHLQWQLNLTALDGLEQDIALTIIDSIDGDGYLKASAEDILQSVQRSREEAVELTIDKVEAVLQQIQRFDPPGVGARDLSECLLLQLAEFDAETPWLEEARLLVREYLDILAARDYNELVKLMQIKREELREVVDLIQSLNPRPGSHLEDHQSAYVIPDVFVRKLGTQWKVELNSDLAPKLRVNAYYASLISRSEKSEDITKLKTHLQEARWFIKSLRSRHETLLKVAKCIVKRQIGFLEYGDEAMKPLILHDIAEELDMHESTISRVTTQKYIHTHRGIFELKYFFSSHVSTDTGGECSSTAIRAFIKKLIAVEDTTKPLSDSKIAKLLSERGIKVARRTVAKYREALVIPPSNERKRLT